MIYIGHFPDQSCSLSFRKHPNTTSNMKEVCMRFEPTPQSCLGIERAARFILNLCRGSVTKIFEMLVYICCSLCQKGNEGSDDDGSGLTGFFGMMIQQSMYFIALQTISLHSAVSE